jgi:hypothetical protein
MLEDRRVHVSFGMLEDRQVHVSFGMLEDRQVHVSFGIGVWASKDRCPRKDSCLYLAFAAGAKGHGDMQERVKNQNASFLVQIGGDHHRSMCLKLIHSNVGDNHRSMYLKMIHSKLSADVKGLHGLLPSLCL